MDIAALWPCPVPRCRGRVPADKPTVYCAACQVLGRLAARGIDARPRRVVEDDRAWREELWRELEAMDLFAQREASRRGRAREGATA